MNDTIVGYETAVLANSIGYKQSIGKLFGNHYYNYKGELDGDVIEEIKHRKDNDNQFKSIAAPSQSRLQEYLRDSFNIYIQITTDFYSDGINHCVQALKYTPNPDKRERQSIGTFGYGDNGEFGTYEEALEFILKKAIKELILIKK